MILKQLTRYENSVLTFGGEFVRYQLIHWSLSMERDYAPLSTACVRALNDKMYDKRKAAALEIEK